LSDSDWLSGTAGEDDQITWGFYIGAKFREAILPVPFYIVPVAFFGVEGAAAEEDEFFPRL